MKIGTNDIIDGIYLVAINKLQESLKKEGFLITKGNPDDIFDLYAEKDEDRRIYEIKIGKNKIQKRNLNKLQQYAKEKNARLFVTYLEQPRTSIIEYEGIELILLDYLMNNMPDEIDALSTHTMLQDVSDVDINSIRISEDLIKVEGTACLEVELLYGSESDRYSDGEEGMSDSFDFYFRVKIQSGIIQDGYFKFDLEHFYQ